MHHPIRSGNQLSIIAKKTAAREADAGIKCSVANSHLLGKRRAAVGGFTYEIFHLGLERIISVVVPAHVDRPVRPYRRPREKVMFAVPQRVIVDTMNGGCAGARVHDRNVDVGCTLGLPTGNLVCRERAIGRITMDTAAGRD